MAAQTFCRATNLLSIFERNPKRLKRIRFLGELFKAGGFELRIAGGAVRDMLKGKEPHDIDFATTAKPEESLKILEPHGDILRIIVTNAGQKHGTVAVKFKEADFDFKRIKRPCDQERVVIPQKEVPCKPEYDEESPYEITTLRCDKSTDGRHAEVVFVSDWKVDAERRDLTMNAMFLTLDEGKLFDYYDGESDLNNGVVRFVGNADKRIKEDYLRILRYFRFWSRYGSDNLPDSATMKTLRENLNGLDIISGERIWQELKKIFAHLPFDRVVNLMLDLRVFNQIGFTDTLEDEHDHYFSFVQNEVMLVQRNIQSYLEKHSDTVPIDQRKKTIELLPTIAAASALQTPEMCLNACERLKFSKIERDSILHIIEGRSKGQFDLKQMKKQLSKVPVSEIPQMLQKSRALLIYHGDLPLLKQLESWTVPTFPLTGNLVASEISKRKLDRKLIKVILDELRDEWADSDYSLDKEALIRRLIERLDSRSAG